MAKSFFGGVPGVSHFSADVPYYTQEEGWDHAAKCAYNPEVRGQAEKRRRGQRAALRAIGFKMKYFQYHNKDESAKAKAKAACEAFAADWGAKVGFDLDVAEGSFL